MEGNMGVETFRTLSQLEGDMKKAERVFIGADSRFHDADARLREAEAAFREAHKAREAALRTLDDCHSEIDRTIAMLREASPAGSRWKSEVDSQVVMVEVPEAFDATVELILKN